MEVIDICFWFFASCLSCRFFVSGSYSWRCEPVDYSQDAEALRALNLAWIFYFSKIIDMIDSVIFLMKKKFSHLSFLHVFHHGIMPFYCWWGPRWDDQVNIEKNWPYFCQDLLEVDRVDSEHFSMQEYIQSCTSTTFLPHLVHRYKNTCGGKSKKNIGNWEGECDWLCLDTWLASRWHNSWSCFFTLSRHSTTTATIPE